MGEPFSYKDRDVFYKAVNPDGKSFWDDKTEWSPGKTISVDNCEPESVGPCGAGIHVAPTIADAVVYQDGPSRYFKVHAIKPIAWDDLKIRCSSVVCGDEIFKEELDELAGFKLWEANHPYNPLSGAKPTLSKDRALVLLKQWIAVKNLIEKQMPLHNDGPLKDFVFAWFSIRRIMRNSINKYTESLGLSILRRDMVWKSLRTSIYESLKCSILKCEGDLFSSSPEAYLGGLFPSIKKWHGIEHLGPDPWRPLLDLWYANLFPASLGDGWILHTGKDAEVFLEYKTDGEQ